MAKKIPYTEKKCHDISTSHNKKMQFEKLNFYNLEEAFKSSKRNKAAGFDDSSSNIMIDAYEKYPISCFQGLNSTRNTS